VCLCNRERVTTVGYTPLPLSEVWPRSSGSRHRLGHDVEHMHMAPPVIGSLRSELARTLDMRVMLVWRCAHGRLAGGQGGMFPPTTHPQSGWAIPEMHAQAQLSSPLNVVDAVRNARQQCTTLSLFQIIPADAPRGSVSPWCTQTQTHSHE
jgi:hypothetical protein